MLQCLRCVLHYASEVTFVQKALEGLLINTLKAAVKLHGAETLLSDTHPGQFSSSINS